MRTDHATATNNLAYVLPAYTVQLGASAPGSVPMRPPGGAWGLLVVGIELTAGAAGATVRFVGETPALDTACTDIADIVAGVWLPTLPPARHHHGDVVVRLHPDGYNPLAYNDPTANEAPAVCDVEVLSAEQGRWYMVRRWTALGPRWPHEIAMNVLVHMRYLAEAAQQDTVWAALNAPDALAELIDTGLIKVGERLICCGHTAIVSYGGLLTYGSAPNEFAVSTVTALASSIIGSTVNGWHFWRRARDHRPLAELRAELARR